MTAPRAANGPAPRGRLLVLESMRAIAAFQVLLLHLFSAFVPALVFHPGTAAISGLNWLLFYFFDGSSAVYVFFALSGYVLTAPFARDADRPLRVIAARWVRLAVPAVAACLLAAAVMALWPAAHIAAGTADGSDWLVRLWRVAPGFAAFWRDAIVNALFIGYDQNGAVTAFGVRASWLPSINAAYVTPLWTISIEFVGSALVLLLVVVRRRLPQAWLAAVLVAAVVFARTPYLCFVVGHLAAVAALAEKRSRIPAVACILGVALGIVLCVLAERYALPFVGLVCGLRAPWLLSCEDLFLFQKRIGSLLVFLSLIQWQEVRDLLSSPRLALAGRLSFPVYLVHWPIVFGLGAAVYLGARAIALSSDVASLVAVVVGLVATLIVAFAFIRVDAAAQQLARAVRRGSGQKSGQNQAGTSG